MNEILFRIVKISFKILNFYFFRLRIAVITNLLTAQGIKLRMIKFTIPWLPYPRTPTLILIPTRRY